MDLDKLAQELGGKPVSDLDSLAAELGGEIASTPGGYGPTTAAKDYGKLLGAGAVKGLAGSPEVIQAAGSAAARETLFKPTEILDLVADPRRLTNKLVGAVGLPPIFETTKEQPLVPAQVTKEQRAAVDQTLARGKIPQLRQLTEYGNKLSEEIEESISPEMKLAMAESQPTGNIIKALETGDFSEISMGKNPTALGLSGQFAKVFGTSAPQFIVAMATKTPTLGAAVGFGQAGAEGIDEARNYIKGMSDEELTKKSEYFRNLIALGYSTNQARQMTEDKAADAAAMAQGTVGALGGAFTSKLIQGGFDKQLIGSAKSRLRQVLEGTGKGFAVSGIEGALSEVAEGVATDLSIDKTIVREIGVDSFANLVLGALGEAAPGAIRGAVAKGEPVKGAEAPEVPPAPVTPVTPPAGAPPAIIPEGGFETEEEAAAPAVTPPAAKAPPTTPPVTPPAPPAAAPEAVSEETTKRIAELDAEFKQIDEAYATAKPAEFAKLNERQGQIKAEIAALQSGAPVTAVTPTPTPTEEAKPEVKVAPSQENIINLEQRLREQFISGAIKDSVKGQFKVLSDLYNAGIATDADLEAFESAIVNAPDGLTAVARISKVLNPLKAKQRAALEQRAVAQPANEPEAIVPTPEEMAPKATEVVTEPEVSTLEEEFDEEGPYEPITEADYPALDAARAKKYDERTDEDEAVLNRAGRDIQKVTEGIKSPRLKSNVAIGGELQYAPFRGGWISGLSYWGGKSGTGQSPSEYGTIYPNKQDAINASIDKMLAYAYDNGDSKTIVWLSTVDPRQEKITEAEAKRRINIFRQDQKKEAEKRYAEVEKLKEKWYPILMNYGWDGIGEYLDEKLITTEDQFIADHGEDVLENLKYQGIVSVHLPSVGQEKEVGKDLEDKYLVWADENTVPDSVQESEEYKAKEQAQLDAEMDAIEAEEEEAAPPPKAAKPTKEEKVEANKARQAEKKAAAEAKKAAAAKAKGPVDTSAVKDLIPGKIKKFQGYTIYKRQEDPDLWYVQSPDNKSLNRIGQGDEVSTNLDTARSKVELYVMEEEEAGKPAVPFKSALEAKVEKITKPIKAKPAEKIAGKELIESESKPISFSEMAKVGPRISDIRYAQDDKIAFTFNGQDFLIKEPRDVILVGADKDIARKWIAKRYGYLLEPFAGEKKPEVKEAHVEGKTKEPITSKTIEEAIDKAETKVDAKKIKQDVKNQFDQAIKRARFLTEKDWSEAKALPDVDAYVTISIPGDGKFKVKNNKERLEEFKKRLTAAIPLKEGKPKREPSAASVSAPDVAFKNMLDDNDIDAAIEYAKLKKLDLDPKAGQVKLDAEQRKKLQAYFGTKEEYDKYKREIGVEEEPKEEKPKEAPKPEKIVQEKVSPDQRYEAEKHAEELGGEIVWQKGELALIRGYSVLSGKPVYAIAKGKLRTRVGVDSYTGDLITKEEKAELTEAVDKLEKAAQAKHEADPFIKFQDGIAMSKDVSPELAGVIKEWKKLLGLKPNIYVTTVEDAKANRNNFTGPHRSIGSSTLSTEEAGTMRKMPDFSYYITFEKSTSKTKMLEVIAHELGHVHEREVFLLQSDEMKVKIRDEFEKWLTSQKDKSARELVNSMRAKTAAKTTVVPSGMKAEKMSPYWKSFGEWYADQVSRWATTTDKPLTSVEKFFKRLGNQMRRFYGLLKNAGYLPNETFKQYLDKIAETQEMPPERGEDGDFAPESMAKKVQPPTEDDVDILLEKHNRPRPPIHPSQPVKDAFMGGYDKAKNTVRNIQKEPLMATNNMIGKVDRAVTEQRNKNIFYGTGLELADRARYGGQVRNGHKQAIASVALVNAIHSGHIASQVMTQGKLIFNPETQMFQADKSDKSMANVVRAKAKLVEKLGDLKAAKVIQAFFEAKRSRSIINEYLDRTAAYEAALDSGESVADASRDLKNIEIAMQKIQMTDEAIDDFIKLDQKYPELREMMDNWTAVNQNMIDMMEFSGLISKQRAKTLRGIKDYVPWYRVMDDMEDVHSAPGGTRGMTNVSREKKFKSGEVDRDIDDIVDNMIHNVLTLTRNSMRNYAANRIVMEYGTRNEKGKIKVFPSEGADKDGVRFNIVAAGKRIVVQIKDPLVAEAVIGMENIDIPMFNALAYLANGLRRSITTFPAFQIAQLFMDAPTAALVTGLKNPGKVWATVFTSFLKNLRKDDPIVAKLRSYGIGGYQSSARTPEKEIQMDIGLIKGSWFAKAMKGLDRFGDASDYAQRRAVYMQTLKETGDELLAIFQANNVIDFQKRGSGGLAQAVTRSVAFMNAYAQSIDVLAKGLAGGGIKGLSRRQAIARMAATGMALSAATLVYCMLVGDDDEYNKLDDQTKMRNIYIPGLNMRLPMHTGASFFFKAIPELIYNAVMKEGTKDEYDAARLKRALGKSALDSLLGPNITPTGVKPVVEIILNKNFFTGGQVTPKGMEDLAAFRQYNQNTSELGKVISSLTGTEKTRLLNPMEADHLVRGLLGTIGAAAMWGTNMLSSNRPEPQAKDNPLYGQFIMPDVARGREDLYYDLKEKTDEAYKTHQDLLKKGRKEEAAEWFKENKDLIKIYGYTSSIETNLKELNGEIRRLSDLPEGKMDPKQKRERINELQEIKMRVLKDVISMRKRAGL